MFRSTIGYEDKLSSTGCCCRPESSGATRTTFQECVAIGGYFKPTELGFDCSEFVCPDISERGCCCSCSYLDGEQKETWLQDQDQPDFGTRDGITPCECTKIGGVWAGAECSEFDPLEYGRQTLCLLGSGGGASVPGAEGDVRWPNACCIYTAEGEIICRNVCTIDECNANGNFSVFYDDGSVCGYVGPSGQPPRFCEGFVGGGEQEEGEGDRQRSVESDYFSACFFENTSREKVECGAYNKNQCDELGGFFAGKDLEENSISCNQITFIKRGKELKLDSISENELSDIPVGSDFYGLGIYCGVFEPGVSVIQSTDTNSGTTSTMMSQASSKNSPKKRRKVAVILSRKSFGFGNFSDQGMTRNQTASSSWSGKHNLYSSSSLMGNLVNAVKSVKINGIGGWTVPSVEECGFIQQNMIGNPDAMVTLIGDEMRFPDDEFIVPNTYTTLTSSVVNIGGNLFTKGYNFVQSGSYKYYGVRDGSRRMNLGFEGETYSPAIIAVSLDAPLDIRLVKTINVV